MQTVFKNSQNYWNILDFLGQMLDSGLLEQQIVHDTSLDYWCKFLTFVSYLSFLFLFPLICCRPLPFDAEQSSQTVMLQEC